MKRIETSLWLRTGEMNSLCRIAPPIKRERVKQVPPFRIARPLAAQEVDNTFRPRTGQDLVELSDESITLDTSTLLFAEDYRNMIVEVHNSPSVPTVSSETLSAETPFPEAPAWPPCEGTKTYPLPDTRLRPSVYTEPLL